MNDASPFAWNRRNKLMFAAAAFYVVMVLLGVSLMQRIDDDDRLARYAVTLLPLIGVLAMVVAAVRVTLMGDEMEQRAAAIGATATLVFVSTFALAWGILEAFLGMPQISALWWGAGSMGLWGVVTMVVWYRFQ